MNPKMQMRPNYFKDDDHTPDKSKQLEGERETSNYKSIHLITLGHIFT